MIVFGMLLNRRSFCMLGRASLADTKKRRINIRMKRDVFDDYINRFNQRDATEFEDYIRPDAKVINGTLETTLFFGIVLSL